MTEPDSSNRSRYGSKYESGCKSFADRLAWYPTANLDEQERQQVEEHVAKCAACADLLEFASQLGKSLEALQAAHPESAVLDRFVVTPDSLSPREHAEIETHLSLCPDCAQVAQVLSTVVQETSTGRAEAGRGMPGLAGSRRSVTGGIWGRCWDLLAASVLRPIPAAVYLVLVIGAIFLVLTQSAPETARGPVLVVNARGPRMRPPHHPSPRHGINSCSSR